MWPYDGEDVTPQTLRDIANVLEKSMGPCERGIVFAKTVGEVDGLSPVFDDLGVSADIDTDLKEARIKRWHAQKTVTSRFLPATSVMATGINDLELTAVVFKGLLHNLLGTFQGAGRAGRAGQKGYIVIIAEKEDFTYGDDNPLADLTRRFLTVQECLQFIITEAMDGIGQTCSQLNGSPCAVCGLDQEWVRDVRNAIQKKGKPTSASHTIDIEKEVAMALELEEAAMEVDNTEGISGMSSR